MWIFDLESSGLNRFGVSKQKWMVLREHFQKISKILPGGVMQKVDYPAKVQIQENLSEFIRISEVDIFPLIQLVLLTFNRQYGNRVGYSAHRISEDNPLYCLEN